MLSPVLISSFDVDGSSVEISAFSSYTITYGENDVAVIFTPSDIRPLMPMHEKRHLLYFQFPVHA